MKRLLILLLAVFFSVPAFATPAQDASIEKLLILTEAQKLNDSAIADSDDIIETTLKPILQLDNMTAEKKKMAESFLNKYKNIVKEEFSWKKMMPDYIRIYRETFTEEELQSLIALRIADRENVHQENASHHGQDFRHHAPENGIHPEPHEYSPGRIHESGATRQVSSGSEPLNRNFRTGCRPAFTCQHGGIRFGQ